MTWRGAIGLVTAAIFGGCSEHRSAVDAAASSSSAFPASSSRAPEVVTFSGSTFRPCNVDVTLAERDRAVACATEFVASDFLGYSPEPIGICVREEAEGACRKRFDRGLDGQRYWVLFTGHRDKNAIQPILVEQHWAYVGADYDITRDELWPDCHCRLFAQNDGGTH